MTSPRGRPGRGRHPVRRGGRREQGPRLPGLGDRQAARLRDASGGEFHRVAVTAGVGRVSSRRILFQPSSHTAATPACCWPMRPTGSTHTSARAYENCIRIAHVSDCLSAPGRTAKPLQALLARTGPFVVCRGQHAVISGWKLGALRSCQARKGHGQVADSNHGLTAL